MESIIKTVFFNSNSPSKRGRYEFTQKAGVVEAKVVEQDKTSPADLSDTVDAYIIYRPMFTSGNGAYTGFVDRLFVNLDNSSGMVNVELFLNTDFQINFSSSVCSRQTYRIGENQVLRKGYRGKVMSIKIQGVNNLPFGVDMIRSRSFNAGGRI